MTKYIDADALKDAVEDWFGGVFDLIAKDMKFIVDEMPAADVEPVRYSQWKCGEDFGGEYYECEACGRRSRPDLYKFDYCPRCGAKMDGGSNEL